MNNWSEQFRIAAKDWVDKDSASRLLDATKDAVLAQRMKALGDVPAAHALRDVKASPEWIEWIKGMVAAKTAANLAKVRMEYLRMKFQEQSSIEATARAEMKL